MDKIEVCFIRLYPDNPEDALIIAGLTARKRKGHKSRVIKDILYAYFSRERSAQADSKSAKEASARAYYTAPSRQAIIEELPVESTPLSEHDKEVLRKNLDELSDMLM
ncbi:MAG: hypothetical protein HQL08_00650 [Nitrospirae bacterium]|nr:hypothetical protein [Nitrospirota bacterium]